MKTEVNTLQSNKFYRKHIQRCTGGAYRGEQLHAPLTGNKLLFSDAIALFILKIIR